MKQQTSQQSSVVKGYIFFLTIGLNYYPDTQTEQTRLKIDTKEISLVPEKLHFCYCWYKW